MENKSSLLICESVPKGLEIGIDYYTYTVTEKFMGFKEIPKGVHFIHYSLSQVAPKIGLFLNFLSDDLVLLRWDEQKEDFDLIENEELKQPMRQKFKLLEFYKNLLPYPHKEYSTWISLSRYITPELISKLEPIGKKIISTYAPEEKQTKDISEKQNETDKQQFSVYYTDIPKKITKKNLSAQEITKLNFDKSELLENLITKSFKDEKMLLGELQFCFICFLIGQDYSGFEQWKKMLNLLCNCDAALKTRPKLFVGFLQVLKDQLQVAPQDFFGDDLTSHNFVSNLLKGLFEMLDDENLDRELKRYGKFLKKFVEKRFNWKLDDMEDEECPVVVDMKNLEV